MKKLLIFLVGAIVGLIVAIHSIEIKNIETTDSGAMITIKILYYDYNYYFEY